MKGLKCRIRNYKGETKVTNSYGLPSMLYEALKSIAPSQEEALNAWAISTTDDFDAATGLAGTDNPVDALAVLGYYNSLISESSSLSPTEIFEVKQFMASNGIRSLVDLKSTMQKIFRSSGYNNPSGFAAYQSELYTPEEYASVDIQKISNLLNKIDGQLLRGDIIVEPDVADVQYKDTRFKTIFGTYEKINQEQIDKDIEKIISNFQNESEYYEKIKSLDYPEFIDRFYSDTKFANDLISRFNQLSRVPTHELRDGLLNVSTTNTYSTVKNTFPANVDMDSLVADIIFLEGIPEEIWMDSIDEVKDTLKEIEYRLSKQSIDIIGISEKASSREQLLELFTNLADLVSDRSEENLINFSNNLDKLQGRVSETSVRLLPERYRSLNIVEVYSDLSNEEMFERYGLIKVDDNLYHKVSTTSSKSDIYEYIYREVVNGNIKLPGTKVGSKLKDPDSKVELLNLITNHINSRETGYSPEVQELVSLYQVAFNHFPPSAPAYKQIVSGISSVRTDPKYLRGEFIQDFYNYVLEQKVDNSEIYRKVLSKFMFNDKGIVAVEPVSDLSGMDYAQEITDYFRIKRDTLFLGEQITDEQSTPEELLYTNFPETTPRCEGQPSVEGIYAVTEPNNLSFIRIGNTSYKKVGQNLNNAVYQQISQPNTLYYSTLTDRITIERNRVQDLLNRYNKLIATQSPQTTDELRDKSGKSLYVIERLSEQETSENLTAISNSQIEVLPLYSAEESQDVYNKISDCE